LECGHIELAAGLATTAKNANLGRLSDEMQDDMATLTISGNRLASIELIGLPFNRQLRRKGRH
jgi:hypothetical protein